VVIFLVNIYLNRSYFAAQNPPNITKGAYSAPPDPLAGFRGPTSKGEREMAGKRREGEYGRDRGWRGLRERGRRRGKGGRSSKPTQT